MFAQPGASKALGKGFRFECGDSEISGSSAAKQASAALASVDDLVGEIEGLVTGAEPDADLHRLLNVMEELSERLMDLGYLLLGCEAMRRLEVVFDALSAMISQTRQALDGLDERASS